MPHPRSVLLVQAKRNTIVVGVDGVTSSGSDEPPADLMCLSRDCTAKRVVDHVLELEAMPWQNDGTHECLDVGMAQVAVLVDKFQQMDPLVDISP